MSTAASNREQRKQPRRKPFHAQDALRLQVVGQEDTLIKATVLDLSSQGMCIRTDQLLVNGVRLKVSGDIIEIKGRTTLVRTCRICWTVPLGAQGYAAGLAFEEQTEPAREKRDPYEVLMIAEGADIEVVHAAYRALARRYHPDNQITADAAKFQIVQEAYELLSDVDRRRNHDRARQESRTSLVNLSAALRAQNGKNLARQQRLDILDVLYGKRWADPQKPEISMTALADALGCRVTQLEFAVWHLREQGLVVRSDNNRISITAKGVEMAESVVDDTHRHALISAPI